MNKVKQSYGPILNSGRTAKTNSCKPPLIAQVSTIQNKPLLIGDAAAELST